MPQQVNWGIQDLSQSQPKTKIDLATPVNIYTSLRADKRAQSLADLTKNTAERKAEREARTNSIIQRFGDKPDVAYKALLNGVGYDAAEKFGQSVRDQQKAFQEQQKSQFEMRQAQATEQRKKSDFFNKGMDRLAKQYSNLPPLEENDTARSDFYVDKIAPFIKEQTGQFPQGTFDGLKDQELMARSLGAGKGGNEYGLKPIPVLNKKTNQIEYYQTKKTGGMEKVDFGDESVMLDPELTHTKVGDKLVSKDAFNRVVSETPIGISATEKAKLGQAQQKIQISKEELAIKKEAEERKAKENAVKFRKFKKASVDAESDIMDFIDRAESVLENPNMAGVTGFGQLGGKIPGTDWADLEADMAFLVSSGVINTMRDLKSKSPTGSTGFGALSEKEMKVLENAFSTISNRDQSPNKMKNELTRIIKKMKKALREHRAFSKQTDTLLGPELTEEESIKNLLRKPK